MSEQHDREGHDHEGHDHEGRDHGTAPAPDGQLDVGDLAKAPERGPCVICGEAGVKSFFAAEPYLERELRHDDGSLETVQEMLPAVHVCRAHFAEVFSERLPIGYCDAEGCRRWGPMGEASPCGAPYRELSEQH